MGAVEIEMRRQYREWVERFWRVHTTLSQIVIKAFPDPDDRAARPSRADVDRLRDLVLREEALLEGLEE